MPLQPDEWSERDQPSVEGRDGSQIAFPEFPTLEVSAEIYAAFLALLNAPPRPNEKLRRTMLTKAPWDNGDVAR